VRALKQSPLEQKSPATNSRWRNIDRHGRAHFSAHPHNHYQLRGILPSLNFVCLVQWTDTNQTPVTPLRAVAPLNYRRICNTAVATAHQNGAWATDITTHTTQTAVATRRLVTVHMCSAYSSNGCAHLSRLNGRDAMHDRYKGFGAICYTRLQSQYSIHSQFSNSMRSVTRETATEMSGPTPMKYSSYNVRRMRTFSIGSQ
jgi:hypothetical protein